MMQVEVDKDLVSRINKNFYSKDEIEYEQKRQVYAVAEFNKGVNWRDMKETEKSSSARAIKELYVGETNTYERLYYTTEKHSILKKDWGFSHTSHTLKKQFLNQDRTRCELDYFVVSNAEERDYLIEILKKMRF